MTNYTTYANTLFYCAHRFSVFILWKGTLIINIATYIAKVKLYGHFAK